MKTFVIVRSGDIKAQDRDHPAIIPFIEEKDAESFPNAKIVMIQDSDHVFAVRDNIKAMNSGQIVAVQVNAVKDAKARIIKLVRNGIEVINLLFNSNGTETAEKDPRHMRDALRDIHTTLVKEGIRDEVTIIACRGIALAEHVTKAMICGADMVAIDIPLVIALECRQCGECLRGEECQIKLEQITAGYGSSRIVNLMAAWRNQILEMLGAMGIREVRRLRGEVGRAMFFEDLERETFGAIFGKRKDKINAE
jgi:glutamate synthase domain-containing protein 2